MRGAETNGRGDPGQKSRSFIKVLSELTLNDPELPLRVSFIVERRKCNAARIWYNTRMRKFDLAFSLGFSCGCSRALRAAGLQFASYPLDWTGSPGIVESARMIADDFAGWLERDDLELVDVRAGRFGNHIYRSRKTHFGFPHEFSSFLTFDEAYGPTVEKHRRRIERLMEHVRASKRVFVAYVERPINQRASDADLLEAKRTLEGKFPGVEFELVYFFHADEVAKERAVAPGVTAVDCSYRRMMNGEV